MPNRKDVAFMEMLSRNMRNVMKEKNLSQVSVCRCMGISAPTLNRYLNGDRTPSVYFIYRFCKVVKVSMDSLLEM